MSIQILPPQLANQIAAGEVVERPASVVKELVENSLDAGASQIDIEIDKGGHKRILIRDNGKGIRKDELALALSRHATSKITELDDLEAIVSLGFRGEALASISSVSRLTMTSKPAEQTEAWSAMAEGLDMAVKVLPAAHPNGTSVEVLDLFFNTPARRKFLRAEKTEFSHIESLIKRIALSRPDVTFVLKHNNKLVKRYRSQAQLSSPLEQTSSRIAEVINRDFITAASAVSSQYDEVTISVWIKDPSLCVSVNPAQFSFVNGRMMRDKLLQHAIRQAYGSALQSEQLPEYVVFIDLPAKDVDVNVHPAKHEVRFHYARLLHDFLVKIIEQALAGFHQQQDFSDDSQPQWLATSNQANYQQAQAATEIVKSELIPNKATYTADSNAAPTRFSGLKPAYKKPAPAQQSFDKLVSYAAPDDEQKTKVSEPSVADRQVDQLQPAPSEAIELVLIEQDYCYFKWQQQLWLTELNQLLAAEPVQLDSSQLQPSPLLVPIRLKLSEIEATWYQQHESFLTEHGFETKRHLDFMIIKQVPAVLRSQGTGQTLPAFFTQLMASEPPSLSLLAKLVSAAKSGAINPQQLQLKLTQLVDENKLNLEQVAMRLDARLLFKLQQ